MPTFAPAKPRDAPVAQLVEHLTLNQGVQGSSPCGCTIIRIDELERFVDFVLNSGYDTAN